MTRQGFINEITYWYDLMDFCSDQGCDYLDTVYDEDEKDEYLNENIVRMAENVVDWSELRDFLESIPTGYDFYVRTAYNEWKPLDNDTFDAYKLDVLDWGDINYIWDDSDEEESLPSSEDDEDCDFTINEPFTIDELTNVCNRKLQQINSEDKAQILAGGENSFISDYTNIEEV